MTDDLSPTLELPPVIDSERLRLPVMSYDEAADVLSGRRRDTWHPDYPRVDDRDAASMVAESGPGASWGPRHIVRAEDGLVVGGIGFFGPPDEGETEVGFGLIESARGNGLATESLMCLLTQTDRRGIRIRASVSPDNAASRRVLLKCGFTETRGKTGGGELIFGRPIPLQR